MATYYVFIPASDMPTAEVTASNTKHARTAYLDYLTRSGQFPYSKRSAMREAIGTERMDPGQYPTDLKLEYGVTEPLETEIEEVSTPTGPVTTEEYREPDYDIPLANQFHKQMGKEFYGRGETPEEPAYSRMPVEQSVQPPPQQLTSPFSNSPIMNLSKKSGGM